MPSPYGTCKFINDASYEELFSVLKVHKELIESKYGSGNGKEVLLLTALFSLLEPCAQAIVRQAYVDCGDLGMDPELLRGKPAVQNGHGVDAKPFVTKLTNGHGHIIPPVLAAGSMELETGTLKTVGALESAVVSSASKIISGVAA